MKKHHQQPKAMNKRQDPAGKLNYRLHLIELSSVSSVSTLSQTYLSRRTSSTRAICLLDLPLAMN
jgi:hypothetical protein